MKKTALLVIDVQNDYFANGKMELHHPEDALNNINRLEQHFIQAKQPIIYIQHIFKDPDAAFFVQDTDGVKLHADLKIDEDSTIIIKHFPNSFFQTTLQQHLKQMGVSQLLITGMMTHMCVDATTRAALELGYETVVVSDATATKSLQFSEHAVDAQTVQYTLLAALQMISELSLTQDVLNTIDLSTV
ncbi:cysteine hydrolase family protein [Acinetobacter rudis]|uniref:cysteine hydrolase family protein n=1 Tax=Acinetobacter rudis TaxID=632955 RepID=UPI003341251B